MRLKSLTVLHNRWERAVSAIDRPEKATATVAIGYPIREVRSCERGLSLSITGYTLHGHLRRPPSRPGALSQPLEYSPRLGLRLRPTFLCFDFAPCASRRQQHFALSCDRR